MLARIHHQRPGTHRALCGDGYEWPSTIPFSREGRPATCPECIRLRQESAYVMLYALRSFLDEYMSLIDKGIQHVTPEYTERKLRELLSQIHKENPDE